MVRAYFCVLALICQTLWACASTPTAGLTQPFYIIGEVDRPGAFEHVSGMSVTEAVAVAGGFTDRANQDKIIISRRDGSTARAALDTEVLPGDLIEVPERFY